MREGRNEKADLHLLLSFFFRSGPSLAAYENLNVQTHSNPAAFPSALRAKRALVVKAEDEPMENPNPIVSSHSFPSLLLPVLPFDELTAFAFRLPRSKRSA